jgi:hypothetical protein
VSVDCKATVKLGEISRGGETRGDNKAQDHDFYVDTHTPLGIVNEDKGDLFINFGSSYKTSDFIIDTLVLWWDQLSAQYKNSHDEIQIKMDNGPECSGVRTQFLSRIVDFADYTGKKIRLVSIFLK